MTTSLRDVTSAQMVHALAELGCFEQDCIVYGYAWRTEDGKRKYRLSEEELVIHQAYDLQVAEHDCLTPIQKWSTRAIIREETKEDMQLYFKLQLADQLKQEFNDAYYEALEELLKVPADNQAEPLLLEWKEEINGYFEEDGLALFAGAVRKAYVTKHLQEREYRDLRQWIKWARKQAGKRLQARDSFERTFYGVACRNEDGTYQFICNADEKTLCNQMQEMDQQGKFHTPMYYRTYWSRRSNDLPAMRKQFVADLKELMDAEYLRRMETLEKMPSAIPTELWESCLKKVEENCTPAAVDGLRYWGNHWNVHMK